MPISIINHTPTYQGNNEPLYYMPCLKVRDNRYIDLSAKLAQALNLTDALEFIEIVTDAQYPDTVFICRSPYTVRVLVATKNPTAVIPYSVTITTHTAAR